MIFGSNFLSLRSFRLLSSVSSLSFSFFFVHFFQLECFLRGIQVISPTGFAFPDPQLAFLNLLRARDDCKKDSGLMLTLRMIEKYEEEQSTVRAKEIKDSKKRPFRVLEANAAAFTG